MAGARGDVKQPIEWWLVSKRGTVLHAWDARDGHYTLCGRPIRFDGTPAPFLPESEQPRQCGECLKIRALEGLD